MKRLLLAASFLTALALPANAGFVLADFTFSDLGGTGFGVLPRLLTLQNSPFENGAVVSNGGAQQFLNNISVGPAPGFAVTGTVCGGGQLGQCTTGLSPNESNLSNIATFGWTSGAQVGVGLDTNQPGSTTGLQFNELVLNIYNASGSLVGVFGGNDPVLITNAQLAAQQGNGNSVFNLGLDAAQQATFNTMLANNPGNLFAGLAAAFGCSPAPCVGNSFDGAESFLGFQQSQAVAIPAPIVGAGLPGLVMAVLGMFGLNRARRKRFGTA